MAADPKVKLLQQALRRAGGKDDRGLLPVVDGKIGPSTTQAVNYIRLANPGGGMPPVDAVTLNQKQVLAYIEPITAWIVKNAVPSINVVPKPITKTNPTPTILQQKQAATGAGDFSCVGQVCRPNDTASRNKAVSLQRLLNQFPPSVIKRFPKGQRIGVDGVIGSDSQAAVRAVIVAQGERQNLHVDAAILASKTPQYIATHLDEAIGFVTKELAEQLKPVAPRAPVIALPPDHPAANSLVFHILTSGPGTGNAVGDEKFRCMAMAMQAQLNRLGQKLGVDGVIGKNTLASVAKVLKVRLSDLAIRDVARDLEQYVVRVREAADRAGAPAPPRATMKAALDKCKIEKTQPVVDGRYFAGTLLPIATLAPPSTPTKPTEQPLPVAPSPKVQQLQTILNTFPSQVIAGFSSGVPLTVTGLVDEPTAAAVRSVLRAAASRQGLLPPASIAQATPTFIAANLDRTITGMQTELPLAQAFYAKATAAPAGIPVAPTVATAEVDTAKVQQLQALLNRFPPQVISRFPGGQPISVNGTIDDDTVAAVRSTYVYIDAMRRSLPGAGQVATPEWIGDGLDAHIQELAAALPEVQAFVAGQTVPVAKAPASATSGVSAGGLQFQVTTAGIVGGGSTPQAFTSKVAELQSHLLRLLAPGVPGLSGIMLGVARRTTRGARTRSAPHRRGTPAAAPAAATPVVPIGTLAQTGVIDTATVTAFNAAIVPKLTSPTPWTAMDIAKSIENATDVAKTVADRQEAARAAQASVEAAAAVPGGEEEVTPSTGTPVAQPTIMPGAGGYMQQQAVAAGLPPEEAQAVVAAAQEAGMSPEQTAQMLSTAAQTRAQAAEPPSEGFPLWAKVTIGVVGGLALVGTGVAVYRSGRSSRQRRRAA